jgi:hypothetical protein
MRIDPLLCRVRASEPQHAAAVQPLATSGVLFQKHRAFDSQPGRCCGRHDTPPAEL